MADAKLEIKVGAVSFSGEGQGEWLSKQLDKILAKLPELVSVEIPESQSSNSDNNGNDGGASTGQKSKNQRTTLASFLKEKKATTGNQQRKFLATAQWLQDGGINRVATGDVTKALSEHNQGKLTNAAQCLINLTKAGWVVREGKQFYVTEEGHTELNK